MTIPVEVGDEPVLRCPSAPIALVAGGDPVNIDMASACHVWDADVARRGKLVYQGTWANPTGLRQVGNGTATLSVSAPAGIPQGATATLSVRARDFADQGATLRFQVTAAASPTMRPVVLDGVRAGGRQQVDLTDDVDSPLPRAQREISIVNVAPPRGATVSASGAVLTVTADGSLDTVSISVVVTDKPGSNRTATGLVTVHVLGKPGPPGQPRASLGIVPGSVDVTWMAPVNHGVPIDHYTVTGGGHTFASCLNTRCLVEGFAVGQNVTFTVTATNVLGGRPAPRAPHPNRSISTRCWARSPGSCPPLWVVTVTERQVRLRSIGTQSLGRSRTRFRVPTG